MSSSPSSSPSRRLHRRHRPHQPRPVDTVFISAISSQGTVAATIRLFAICFRRKDNVSVRVSHTYRPLSPSCTAPDSAVIREHLGLQHLPQHGARLPCRSLQLASRPATVRRVVAYKPEEVEGPHVAFSPHHQALAAQPQRSLTWLAAHSSQPTKKEHFPQQQNTSMNCHEAMSQP